MEFSQLLDSRRSVRNYKEGVSIERDTIEELIRAAQEAPSWKNSQTGRYYAVISPEAVEHIREECLPEFNRNRILNAPVLIIAAFVSGISGFNTDGNPVNELGDEWGAYDLGLQNQNLMLRARELGLDTLIMGMRDSKKLRKELGIPDDQHIAAVIAVGKRNGDPARPERKKIGDILKFF